MWAAVRGAGVIHARTDVTDPPLLTSAAGAAWSRDTPAERPRCRTRWVSGVQTSVTGPRPAADPIGPHASGCASSSRLDTACEPRPTVRDRGMNTCVTRWWARCPRSAASPSRHRAARASTSNGLRPSARLDHCARQPDHRSLAIRHALSSDSCRCDSFSSTPRTTVVQPRSDRRRRSVLSLSRDRSSARRARSHRRAPRAAKALIGTPAASRTTASPPGRV